MKTVMKFVIFDVQADLAQFKKPFTTMSPQTFGFPTGTALVGMIAAIVGLDKTEYWKYFPKDSYTLGVGVKKPVKKVVIPMNTLKTTLSKHFSRFDEHKRTTMEFIKDAEFRIWLSWEEKERFQQLVEYLKNHQTYYTLSLGLAWNLANYSYVGNFEGEKKIGRGELLEFQSVIRKDFVEEIDFEGRKIFTNRIPVRMKSDNSREVEQYSEYLFESDGNRICARVKEYIELQNGDRIVPL